VRRRRTLEPPFGYIRGAKLARDEFVGRGRPNCAHGVEVAGIMHSVVREAERLQSDGVHIIDEPAIQIAEQSLARHQRFEVASR